MFFAEIGPVYQKLVVVGAVWGLFTILLVLFVGVTTGPILVRWPALSRVLSEFAFGRVQTRMEWLAVATGCGVLLAISDFHGFSIGFFRYDDFAFVQDARDGPDILEYLGLYHNDHALPLFRIEIMALVMLCGKAFSAFQLASLFNTLAALTFFGLLLSGCWLLSGLDVRRLGIACFCVVLWMWPSWGEFTSGFYTILIYPQTVVFGFISIGSVLHAIRTRSRGLWVLALITSAAAPLVDVSGVWVFPILLAIVWAKRDEVARINYRRFLVGLFIVAGLLLPIMRFGPFIRSPSENLSKTPVGQ